jgi:hypothetical protein
MIEVTLSWFEAAEAARLGVQRQILNLRAGNKHRHGFDGEGWDIHIEGCMAERALAKGLDKYWEPVALNSADLEGDVGRSQIRSTKHRNGRLMIHEDDKNHAVFYLVRGPWYTPEGVLFELVGSKLGSECKRVGWWEDPGTGRPAYFVPNTELDPLHA